MARRAREADRLERKERQAVAQQRATAEPVRVHAATQPTFTRYIFAVPANTTVSADRTKERLTLTFDAPIKFDLADVVAVLPRAIGGIDTELRDDSALVRFNFLAKIDIRSFRDDGGYMLDIVGADNKPDEQSAYPSRQLLRSKVRRRKPPRPQRSRPRRRTMLPRTAPKRQRLQEEKPTSRHRQQSPRQTTGSAAGAACCRGASGAGSIAGRQASRGAESGSANATPKTPPQPAPSADTAKAAPPAPPPAPPAVQRDGPPRPTKLRPTTRRRHARAPPIPRARSQPSSPAKAPT